MTLFGWDLSHYDSPTGHAAVGEGFSFFTHKAGGDANDAEMAAWWADMKPYRNRALLGAYWVLYPGAATSRADAFLSRIDATCPGWKDGPFILQVDCEKWNGDSSTVPTKSDIRTFCDRLKARMPKLTPIVYAPQWVYGNTLTGLGYPLWASSYVNGSGTASGLYPGDGSSKWGAYSGQTPAVLQFTSSATIAGQTTCDANAFRGTLAELTALIAPGWDIDMPLTDDDFKAMLAYDPNNGDGIPNPFSDASTNPTMSMKTALYNAVLISKRINDQLQPLFPKVDALKSAVDALQAKPGATVDIAALAAALAPEIDGITEDEMRALLERTEIKVHVPDSAS